jgi:hypothetical protein
MTLRAGFLNLMLAACLTVCSSAYAQSDQLDPPPAHPFPEGTRCEWIMGQEGEVAYCVLPDGTQVMVPSNCWQIPNTICRPILEAA